MRMGIPHCARLMPSRGSQGCPFAAGANIMATSRGRKEKPRRTSRRRAYEHAQSTLSTVSNAVAETGAAVAGFRVNSTSSGTDRACGTNRFSSFRTLLASERSWYVEL
ncbi:hypothetical protein MRX96_016327 [Rhipicephalus microplus]